MKQEEAKQEAKQKQKTKKFDNWLKESITQFDKPISKEHDKEKDYAACEEERKGVLQHLKDIQSAWGFQYKRLAALIGYIIPGEKLELKPGFEVKSEASVVLVTALQNCLLSFSHVDQETLPRFVKSAFDENKFPEKLVLINEQIVKQLLEYKKEKEKVELDRLKAQEAERFAAALETPAPRRLSR